MVLWAPFTEEENIVGGPTARVSVREADMDGTGVYSELSEELKYAKTSFT